jgi:hypothetical protein
LAVAIYSILQASESCLLGGVRKARTNVGLIVRERASMTQSPSGLASFFKLIADEEQGG